MAKKKKKEEAEDNTYREWLASQELYEYPDDLPFPRKRRYGPQTPEVAQRYLDSDYPLPGSFPESRGKSSGSPEWIEYLEVGRIFPGVKLSREDRRDRMELIGDFADSDFSDVNTARAILELDRLTGFNPLFKFEYEVLNMNRFSQVLFFELNGVKHSLHWHNVYGWHIDNQPISEDPEEARDNFALFALVASSLNEEGHYYPVVNVLKIFHGAPDRVLAGMEPGIAPEASFLGRFGVRRNPDSNSLVKRLSILEADYFGQPPFLQRKDLQKINSLREQLGMPQVDYELKVIVAEEDDFFESEVKAAPIIVDPFKEVRPIYQHYLDKAEELKPYQLHCKKLVRAMAPVGGQTPVMPLATMGPNGGPMLCDACGKQIPLEGGRFHGVSAGAAWNADAKDKWYSYILGGVTYMIEANNTFRLLHGYESGGCFRVYDKKIMSSTRPDFVITSNIRNKLTQLLIEEEGFAPDSAKEFTDKILRTLSQRDIGFGINTP